MNDLSCLLRRYLSHCKNFRLREPLDIQKQVVRASGFSGILGCSVEA